MSEGGRAKPSPPTAYGGGRAKPNPPALCVHDLTYAYPGGERVLNGISFTALPGETIAIAGLSGCGKSTLCCCLTGLAPALLGGELGGRIELLGENICELSPAQVATRAGFVFQDASTQLVTTTVEDELAFGPENKALKPRLIRERVDRELQRFGLEPLALRAPNTLSGGEQRVVALASVLTLDPPLVVLDEPFTHLDEHGTARVRAALLELRDAGRTLVIVEHDLSLVDFADRYLVLRHGRVASSSPTPPPEFTEEPLAPPAAPSGGAS